MTRIAPSNRTRIREFRNSLENTGKASGTLFQIRHSLIPPVPQCHTRRRFLEACLEAGQKFVVDNTNPTVADRLRYIEAARAARYSGVGYYFQSSVEACLRRNANRAEWVPEVAILSIARKLELPTADEGFDSLSYVRLVDGRFVVEAWQDGASENGEPNNEI